MQWGARTDRTAPVSRLSACIRSGPGGRNTRGRHRSDAVPREAETFRPFSPPVAALIPRDPKAFLRLKRPEARFAVEMRRADARVQLDVAAQVEPVRHMVHIGEDRGLGAVTLGPAPVLLQIFREGIGVFHALDVAAATRIAVPVPGAADAVAGLEGAYPEPGFPQPVDGVKAADACADDRDIKICSAHPASLGRPGPGTVVAIHAAGGVLARNENLARPGRLELPTF